MYISERLFKIISETNRELCLDLKKLYCFSGIRYLVKAYQQATAGNSLTPTVAYIARLANGRRSPPWDNTIAGIVEGFFNVAVG